MTGGDMAPRSGGFKLSRVDPAVTPSGPHQGLRGQEPRRRVHPKVGHLDSIKGDLREDPAALCLKSTQPKMGSKSGVQFKLAARMPLRYSATSPQPDSCAGDWRGLRF